MERLDAYTSHYSQASFWRKTAAYAKVAGQRAIVLALQLYYAARAPETPGWAKTTIYGALGYFISTVDAVPDMAPVVGYSDDLIMLAAAAAVVAQHITPEIKERAAGKVAQWFDPSPHE